MMAALAALFALWWVLMALAGPRTRKRSTTMQTIDLGQITVADDPNTPGELQFNVREHLFASRYTSIAYHIYATISGSEPAAFSAGLFGHAGNYNAETPATEQQFAKMGDAVTGTATPRLVDDGEGNMVPSTDRAAVLVGSLAMPVALLRISNTSGVGPITVTVKAVLR